MGEGREGSRFSELSLKRQLEKEGFMISETIFKDRRDTQSHSSSVDWKSPEGRDKDVPCFIYGFLNMPCVY